MNAPIGNYVSEYNTESTKYTGPLAIVKYTGPRNFDNQMHGEGEVLFANGATYVGGFKNDMLHGYGVMTDHSSGTVYAGDFEEDKRHGKGVFTYAGGKYEGEYANNKRNGQGKEVDSEDNVFEGQFVDGDFVKGKVFYSNDDIYVGEYKDDCRHGRGKLLRFDDGAVFEGLWENDEFKG